MKISTLIFIKALVLSFSVSAFANVSESKNCTPDEELLMCGLSVQERYCFANVSCDGDSKHKIACEPTRERVNGELQFKCPSLEDCMAESKSIDMQGVSERLAMSRVINNASCKNFADPNIAPPTRGGGGR